MKIKILIAHLLIGILVQSQPVLHPFPQHSKYQEGIITPTHISSKEMDDGVRLFYDQWKERYIKADKCSGYVYVWSENAGKNRECVSEGQGYGMIIVVLMAGYDPDAQKIFDGLYQYYNAYPSKRNKYLMSWAQQKNCQDFEASSATDGDIDIAYSLLLAGSQWPPNGKIDYLREAKNIISAILEQEINKHTFSVLESNAIEWDSKDYFDMRSSDFIPSQIRAFNNIYPDQRWIKVLDNNYKLLQYLQTKYSPQAGLLPDFIQNINRDPTPARKNYLESKYDGMYNYNACRIPWRIAIDYIINGDPRAKKVLEPINNWIRKTTDNNPDNISAGYSLNGEDLPSRNYEALSFITPFATSAMIDVRNQDWLNKLWDYIVTFKIKDFDYYDNTIKIINLIILSHNYWTP